ncbi:MAG: NADH-quinone oxidoreductase subunit H [Deltaproteobacteria bacterium]|nr:NADH-quinone oxidoreductase subunit H [Deltaproteobacteria bacterium]
MATALGLVGAPLLLGVINKTKAFFAGRRGPPLLQAYFDLVKLLGKGAVYSRTTTWVFCAGPIVGLAATLVALLFVPLGGVAATFAFQGDLFLVVYLLGLGRFLTVLAALDTGSSFEGMGANREVKFATLAEPTLLLALLALIRVAGSPWSLSPTLGNISTASSLGTAPVIGLVAVALVVLLLSENSRIPVDDPNTHLELTMIHEVMVLDHGGPDLAFILYGAALKLWLFATLLAGIVVPVRTGNLAVDLGATTLVALAVGVVVGIVESSMARLRLIHVTHLLVGALVLAAVALLLAVGWSR